MALPTVYMGFQMLELQQQTIKIKQFVQLEAAISNDRLPHVSEAGLSKQEIFCLHSTTPICTLPTLENSC
ncbi:MAG: hypothetical protein OXC41_02860 [Gammaproteobacteria bacterium]|nr:hypothetical protein [Gammaproteobacteria bacterium]